MSATACTARSCVPKGHREYDRSGRLRSRQRRLASQPSLMPAPAQKQFEYDPADNPIGKLDQQPAAQHRQLLHYDATGRIIASQDSLHGQRETFAYDAAANLLDGPQAGAGLVPGWCCITSY
ncbi:hypothetical protein EUX53_11900 [Pseudomonas orientalis]|nr:hypothetical protein EUX53_11900 [Pseudomonas orientalis]